MQKITPFLWFDHNAEEAASYYVETFKQAKIGNIRRYGEAGPGTPGTVLTIEFEIEGHQFIGLNGGPHYSFSPAVSFFVNCEDQAEVDHLWARLSEGGQIQQCGWVSDRFGVTWQIIPRILGELLQDPDAEKAGRVMRAMLQMTKIETEALLRAYEG